ncbi:SusC/RagA family TonB-linked outer membrane protein [Euzebyella marina]|nr:TonB-dependent receptor [Euzebyella marina]
MKTKLLGGGLCYLKTSLLFTMRIFILFFTILSFGFSPENGFSQNERVKFNSSEILSVEEILEVVKKQTDYNFIYRSNLFEGSPKIKIAKGHIRIEKLLEKCVLSAGLEFEFANENSIYLRKKQVAKKKKEAQTSVTGTVTDADGIPLPGANIVEKGTTKGVTADFDGKFQIAIADSNAILVVSYIGYASKEVSVNGQSSLQVMLEESAAGLDEVVVVGYGTKRKRDIVSAVSVVDLKEVKDVPATDISRMILGQAPGVVVSQNSGRPGQEMDIVIRGLSSLGADSKPLYVVDGFAIGTSTGLSIDPGDIESITILKDAASTAIYGARGSNGVVLINTKSAKAGLTSVTLDVVSGIQNIPSERRTKMLNAVEFGQFQKESWVDKFIFNEGREPAESEIPLRIRNPENNTTYTDWQDEIMNSAALFKKYNLTVTSGGERSNSIISMGYLNQEGAIVKTNFERFNVRANINTRITDNINIGLNVTGSRSNERYIPEGSRDLVTGIALWADPREPIYNEDGSFNNYLGGYNADGDLIFGSLNPVQLLHEEKNKRHINRLLSNMFVEVDFLKDFKFKSSANVSLISQRLNSFRPSTLASNGFNGPPPRDASLSEEYGEEINWSADQLLSYSKSIGESHGLDVLLGYTAQEATLRNIGSQGTKFPDDQIRFLQNAEIFSVNSGETSWSLLAYFARLNYDFKDKYLLSATYRREGSSRFGSNNRWGSFPAVSLGWRVSDESFLQNADWLNDLKLRASFGVTGNNNIGNYPSLSTLTSSNYILGNSFAPGKVLNSLANRNLGWEESDQFNYGVDITILDNTLVFTGEYYKKTTENMLLPVNIPVISGFESTFTNIGKVQNTGIEFALGYRNSIGEDLRVRSNFNISFNDNEVLAINDDNDQIRNGDFYGTNNVSQVGRPIGMLHGYRNLGVFNTVDQINSSPTQDGAIPGSFIYYDANGDGEISYDTTDWVEIGNPHPEYVWSFNLGLDYKAFDFNAILTGAENYDVYRNIESTTLNLDGVFNVDARAKERWRSAENPGNGRVPTTTYWKWERESNSFYVHDASHIWIKNVSLGYTIPLNPEGAIRNARIYINTDNLYLFSDFPGGNPQVSTAGGINPGRDDSAYPVPRTVTLGATLSF